jgi:phenylalanyl-tRNA synthetase alpha chain
MKPTLCEETMQQLSITAYRRSIAVRDLTDPAQGPHSLQQLVTLVTDALRQRWGCSLRLARANPVIPIEDNYDRLHYPADAVARDARYTRYVSERLLLRTHTSAMIPPLLAELTRPLSDVLLACPGLVYRRDSIDRLHTGEPHQLDLWRVRHGRCGEPELHEMIASVVSALLPGTNYRTQSVRHPYTDSGLQIDVQSGKAWVEIGECGLALPALLDDAGLPRTRYAGLAMGLGLDRILMLRKGIDDIRLLRSTDPRVCVQMLDLEPYRPVSKNPATLRDLSIAVDEATQAEDLGDRVREALGQAASSVEEIRLLSETPWADLPEAARQRIGMRAGQKNVLVRVVLRDLERTLTADQANVLRDCIYARLHEGTVHQWAAGPPES